MWRYIEVMPVINRENIITLGEGLRLYYIQKIWVIH